jgi:hypothetical protein
MPHAVLPEPAVDDVVAGVVDEGVVGSSRPPTACR